MKPVSIMWSQGVDPAEAELAVTAVRDFLRVVYAVGTAAGLAVPPTAIRPFGTWYIPSIPRGSPYWGTGWYVDSSYDARRQQVVGSRFLELVRDEPWQKQNPHWDVAVIDRDLVDRDDRDDFSLAATIPELATVLSVHRVRGLVRQDQREAALRRLVLHHFGRVLGLPSPSRHEDLDLIGDQRFCANLCAMRRATTIDQVVRFAEQEGREQVRLCGRCRLDPSLNGTKPDRHLSIIPSGGLVDNRQKQSQAPSGAEHTYVVQPGDTLVKIAEKVYGNSQAFTDIYNANQGVILDPDHLVPGTQLYIPPSATRIHQEYHQHEPADTAIGQANQRDRT